MNLIKTTSILSLSVILALQSPILTFAASNSNNLSKNQTAAISQNCASIKQSLKHLQHADVRTRIFFGSTYQSILTNFMTPLNLRLVKDNQPNPELVQTQTDFSSSRNNFTQNYINYSKKLEKLLAIDCRFRPQDFYKQLNSTRQSRAKLARSAQKTQTILENHLKIVEAMQAKKTKPTPPKKEQTNV